MKGLLGVKGILILVTLIVLFGGAMYDVTTTGVRCAIGTMGNSNYTCEEFGFTIGSVFVSPDRNIATGVDAILTLREYQVTNPEQYQELAGLISTDEQGYRNQILIGIAGLIVLLGALTYFMLKITPSSILHIDSKFTSVAFAILLFISVYMFYTGWYEGDLQIPFSGLWKLVTNSDVLLDVVDHTSALPGTLTTDDIIGENGTIAVT